MARIVICSMQTRQDGAQQFMSRVDYLCHALHEMTSDIIGLHELMRWRCRNACQVMLILREGRDTDGLGESPCIALDQRKRIAELLFTEKDPITGAKVLP